MSAYKINPFLISLKPIYLTYEGAKKNKGRKENSKEVRK